MLFQLFVSFFKVGALTFGGGYAMMPMIEREIVNRRGWCTMPEVLDIYAVSQCLPGAIAINTAAQVGFRKKGAFGGICAALGAVTPSVIIISVIAALLQAVWGNAIIESAFAGISVVVCALILSSVVKFYKSSAIDTMTKIIFVAVTVMCVVLDITPFIYIIVAACIGIASGLIKAKIANKPSDKAKEENK